MDINNIVKHRHRAIHLREYVRSYTPKKWRCSLECVMCIPYWNNNDYDGFERGDYLSKLKHPVIEHAIKSYFRKK